MWEWLKKWFPIQFRNGEPLEGEKDVKVFGFVIRLYRVVVPVVVYWDYEDAE